MHLRSYTDVPAQPETGSGRVRGGREIPWASFNAYTRSKPSVITCNPAIRDHPKCGQRNPVVAIPIYRVVSFPFARFLPFSAARSGCKGELRNPRNGIGFRRPCGREHGASLAWRANLDRARSPCERSRKTRFQRSPFGRISGDHVWPLWGDHRGSKKRRTSSKPPCDEIRSAENVIGRSRVRARIWFFDILTLVAPRCGDVVSQLHP